MRNSFAAAVRSIQRVCVLGVVVALALFLPGCQNYLSTTLTTGPAGNSQFIAVTPSGTIPVDIGKSITISATVVGDPSQEGVTWAISGPGTLANQSIGSVTYNAPATGVGTGAYVTAYSVAAPTQYFISTILLTALPSFVTTTLPDGTSGAAYDQIVTVTAGAPPFAWSIVKGSLPPGLTQSVGSLESLQIEGTPSTAGTYNFTLEATDATGGSTQQALTIVIDPAPTGAGLHAQLMQNPAFKALAGDNTNNPLLAGKYAFRFSGKNNGAIPTAAAGSFAADGAGNITAGIADRNGVQGPQTGLGFTGTYNVGADHLGIMMLNFADGSSSAYALAATAEGTARFIEFDDLTGTGTRGAGEIARQDSSAFSLAKLAGNYVFALNGNDANAQPLALAGTFAAGSSGAISGTRFPVTSAISGAFSVDVSGRGTATVGFSGGNSSIPGSLNMSFTVVSANEWFAVETDGAGKPKLSGVMQIGSSVGIVTQAGTVSIYQMAGGQSLTLVQGSSPYSQITASAQQQDYSTSSFSTILAGASDRLANSADPQVVASLGFDGAGNLSLKGASSSSAGLQLIPHQQGTYSVSGTSMSFANISLDALSLDGTITAPGQISVTRHNGVSSTIVVQK